MDKNKLAKIVVKAAIGGVTAVLIGTTVKQEKRVNELLDRYFDGMNNIASE